MVSVSCDASATSWWQIVSLFCSVYSASVNRHESELCKKDKKTYIELNLVGIFAMQVSTSRIHVNLVLMSPPAETADKFVRNS